MINIEPVKSDELDICTGIIYESELGKRYYPNKIILRERIKKACGREKIYLAKEDEVNIGLLWYQTEGIFHQYPYLHMIVIDKDHLHRGYAHQLMNYYEKDIVFLCGGSLQRTKSFLLVGDFNTAALELYKKRGYIEICRMPDLFRRGITEIMMSRNLSRRDLTW